MKILFIINSLKHRSGSERVATQLANQLAQLDEYSIDIVNRDTTHASSAYKLDKNINVTSLNGNLINFYLKLRKYIRNNKFDSIIVHNMGKLSLLSSLISSTNNLISLEHGSFTSRRTSIKQLSKILYKNIDQVITLTKNDKKAFEEFHSNVVVIPNFSPYPISKKNNSSSKTIIAIGRLVEEKNYIHLLKAWELIHQDAKDWNVQIYGDGEQRNLLDDYINKKNISNISINKSTPDIEKVYEQASFFVMSSKREGLPMVLIESQSFGLPIISYDCPHGPSEIINNNVNGILVENQNIEKLAGAMLSLINSEENLKSMSDNALINAKKYEAQHIICTWINQVFNKNIG